MSTKIIASSDRAFEAVEWNTGTTKDDSQNHRWERDIEIAED